MCSVEDPKHSQINVYSDYRRPPTPQESTESMWVEMNVLNQKILLFQSPQPSPQCDVPPQRSSSRSPPQQCSISRVATVEKTTVEPSAEEVIPLDVRVYMEERTEGKIQPERGALKSQRAGTGPGAPGQ